MAPIAKHKPVASGNAKAWSNLNGTGTIAERDSFNISGYTDNGTGDYTFSFSNNMNNTTYMTFGGGGETTTHLAALCQQVTAHALITSAVRAQSLYGHAAVIDLSYVGMAIHGDLA